MGWLCGSGESRHPDMWSSSRLPSGLCGEQEHRSVSYRAGSLVCTMLTDLVKSPLVDVHPYCFELRDTNIQRLPSDHGSEYLSLHPVRSFSYTLYLSGRHGTHNQALSSSTRMMHARTYLLENKGQV